MYILFTYILFTLLVSYFSLTIFCAFSLTVFSHIYGFLSHYILAQFAHIFHSHKSLTWISHINLAHNSLTWVTHRNVHICPSHFLNSLTVNSLTWGFLFHSHNIFSHIIMFMFWHFCPIIYCIFQIILFVKNWVYFIWKKNR